MDATQLKLIFEKPYNRADWYNISKEIFGADKLLAKPVSIKLPENEWEAVGFELGNFETTDGRLIGLYELQIGKKAQLHRNRKGLKDLLAKVYKENVDAALIVFAQNNKWRFSYVSEIYTRNSTTGKREKKATDPKRYTYLLGEGERCKTAADRFSRIKQSSSLFTKAVTLEALEEAFNVEKMSKAFFNEYRKHYGAFTAFLTGKDENSKEVKKAHPFLRSVFNGDEKHARDFVKKLLGRIVFLYFLQKKGWLGVPENGKWGEGNEDFLHQLFLDYKDKEGFYALVLVPLFFETLNTERDNDLFKIKPSLFNKAGYNKLKIPYLNGGLFDDDEPETDVLDFPRELFEKLFLFFDQYNFTVYEDSPDEHTVAVDPEMLGHIFENLLEDNKDKGAYYTPKEIVHYMCRESLAEYLYTKLNPATTETYQELGKDQTDLFGNKGKEGQLSLIKKHDAVKEQVSREAIEKFIKNHEAADIIDFDESILKALKEVKVCDPAIGSGAFPMGILMEIFNAVEVLFNINPDTVNAIWKLGSNNQVFNAAKAKENIIQNSIYGVDIEKGAVDIARLRFWLSLVVDENKPKPLPNLDYKIVVGNSLLSKFEDEVIDIDWTIKASRTTEATRIVSTQQESKLNTLQAWQTAYFHEKREKTKQQLEIRNIKIDILINQLTLSKISFQHSYPKLGGFAPTAKEIQKNLENEIVIAGYDLNIKKLEALKKDKKAVLEFFDWKLDFPEVMNDKVNKGEVGFDIVIGNPPYIQLQNNGGALAKELQGKGYETFERTGDIYTLFYEKGYYLLKDRRHLVFITSNKWMRAGYGESTRNFFATKTNPLLLIDFAGQKIFEATVDTNILLFQRNINSKLTSSCIIKENCLEDISNYVSHNKVQCSFTKSSSWVILNTVEQRIKEKIEKVGTPLKDWNVTINYGIKTGYNEAFIINREKRNELIRQDSKSAEIIRPILRGRDIKRYTFEFPDLWLITTHNGIKEKCIDRIDVNHYPAIKKHLDHFYSDLEKRADKGDTPYNLRNCAYMEDFSRPKIVWGEISDKTKFAVDLEGKFVAEATTFLMTGESLLYLLGFLNSKLSEYIFAQIGTTTGVGTIRWKKFTIEQLRIPKIAKEKEGKYNEVVSEIINHSSNQSKLSHLTTYLDQMIYEEFGLSETEIKIVEKYRPL